MRRSKNLGRVRWSRVRWLLPVSLGLCAGVAASLPAVLDAAREHQVRAYFDPPSPMPPEWRQTGPEPVDLDGLLFGSRYVRAASR